MKKRVSLLLLVMSLLLIVVGCSNDVNKDSEIDEAEEQVEDKKDLPEIDFAWGNDLHSAHPFLASERPEDFADKPVQLKKLSENKFMLIEDGEEIAVVNFLAAKGGSEAITLMGQGHLDIAIISNTSVYSAIDQGIDVKMLMPFQAGGMSMVMNKDTDIFGWDEVSDAIRNHGKAFKIGYHSPVSGPRILIESLLKEDGFVVTEDPNEVGADVLMVDLKGVTNLLPSLPGGHVDAWVGPSLQPELAVQEDVGKIVMNLEDYPPKGKWTNFPCCIVTATSKSIDEHPDIIKAVVKLMDECVDYTKTNPEDTAEVFADKTGGEVETVKMSSIQYDTEPSQDWIDGIDVYLNALKKMGKFTGNIADWDFDKIKEESFYFDFIEDVRANK